MMKNVHRDVDVFRGQTGGKAIFREGVTTLLLGNSNRLALLGIRSSDRHTAIGIFHNGVSNAIRRTNGRTLWVDRNRSEVFTACRDDAKVN